MQGFVPNDYVTVNLLPGDRIDLFSEFSIVGHRQRGAYFTDHNSIATLQVYDPVGNPIVSTIKRQQGVILFDVRMAGAYKFRLQTVKQCAVTLALEMAVEEDFDDFGEHILKGSPDWAAVQFQNKKDLEVTTEDTG